MLLALCVSAASAFAQRGGEIIGFDAPTAARAGVDVAIAEEVSALVTNPAGLTQLENEWTLQFSARAFWPGFKYEDPLNPRGESYDDPAFAPYFAVAFDPDPGDSGRAGDLRLAAGLYHLSAFQNDFNVVTQDYPAPVGTDRESDFIDTALHLGAAYRISDRVAVGLTVSVSYSKLDAREPLELSVLKFRGESPLGIPWGELLQNQIGLERVRIDGDLSSDPVIGVSSTIGFLWTPTPNLSFGISYRTPRLQEDYEADVGIDISRIFGEPDPVTFPDGFAIDYDGKIGGLSFPQAVSIGGAWRIDDTVRIAAELRWIGWSMTHDRLDIALENGDNPGFNAFVGSDELDVEERLLWDDQLSFGVSLEWFIDPHWTARIGGSAATNPVDHDAANPLAPGFAEYTLGVGGGYRGDGWGIDVAWLHSFEKTLSVGTSAVSSDFDGSRQTIGVDSVILTLTIFF